MEKQAAFLLFFFCIALAGRAQKQHFFQRIGLSFNGYIAGPDIDKNHWKPLSKAPLSYNLDTFYTLEAVGKGGLPELKLATVGVRLSKMLFANAHGKLKNRLEWRTGLQLGSYHTDAWFSSRNYNEVQTPPYSFNEVQLDYKCHIIDINNQVVYKGPSMLKKKLGLYAGAGVGVLIQQKGKIAQEVVTFKASPSGGNGTYIAPESGYTNTLKARTAVQPYINIITGLQWRWRRSFSLLLEAAYQDYFSLMRQRGAFRQSGTGSVVFSYQF